MFTRGVKTSRVLGRFKGKEAVDNIFSYLEPIYAKKPKKLREEEIVLVELVYFMNAMNQGGFETYYRSDKGDFSSSICNHFSRIDLEDGYQLMYESMQVFSGMISKEAMIRNMYIDEHKDVCLDKWQSLNQAYKTLESRIYGQIIEYVRDNILDFR